jgi:hypothetical protein
MRISVVNLTFGELKARRDQRPSYFLPLEDPNFVLIAYSGENGHLFRLKPDT